VKSSLLVAFAFGVGVLTVCEPALAHHGNAVYEDHWTEFKQVRVTKFAWANPHALIFFEVKDPKARSWSGLPKRPPPKR
jgi:hypothetical protein